MPDIGIGIIGGGYMGKAHAVAFSAVGAVFDTALKPRLEMVCASSDSSAERYRAAYGFARATSDWQVLVNDPKVEAIVIASPQFTHREIAVAAFALGKPVLCEKPLGASLEDSRAMVAAAEAAGAINMVGFNYIRTPASQYAYDLIANGAIGDCTGFRCEHVEDFFADPMTEGGWRMNGMSNGTLGDLAPHPINAALRLMGNIESLIADIETVFPLRPDGRVTNDDSVHIVCRFESGIAGHIHASRVAVGHKMGYRYEIRGLKGAIRFDQEDQNALHLYRAEGPEAERGFTKILIGPSHPDYGAFCQGPGHGTGYQDQIIIEAKDFLNAIHCKQNTWPTFAEGMEVNRIVTAAMDSSAKRAWVDVADY